MLRCFTILCVERETDVALLRFALQGAFTLTRVTGRDGNWCGASSRPGALGARDPERLDSLRLVAVSGMEAETESLLSPVNITTRYRSIWTNRGGGNAQVFCSLYVPLRNLKAPLQTTRVRNLSTRWSSSSSLPVGRNLPRLTGGPDRAWFAMQGSDNCPCSSLPRDGTPWLDRFHRGHNET